MSIATTAGFDEVAWRARCDTIATEALLGSGLSHDLWQQRVSFAIEVLLKDMPEDVRPRAMEIAREYEYATPAELEQAQIELAEMGCCSHGIDRDCCPLGCGDIEDDYEEDDNAYKESWSAVMAEIADDDLVWRMLDKHDSVRATGYVEVGDANLSVPLFARFQLTGSDIHKLMTVRHLGTGGVEAIAGTVSSVEPEWSNPYLRTTDSRLEIVQAEKGRLSSAQLKFRAQAAESGMLLESPSWTFEDLVCGIEEAMKESAGSLTELGEFWLGGARGNRLAEAKAAFPAPPKSEVQEVQQRSWISRIFRPRG